MTTVGNIDKYHEKITLYDIYWSNESHCRIECFCDQIQKRYWDLSEMRRGDGTLDPVNWFLGYLI